MRILTFLHSFEPGGVERDALRLADAWSKAGHDVHLAMGRGTGVLAREAPPVPRTIFETSGSRKAQVAALRMIMQLPGLVRRLKPDILFCAGNTYSVVAVALRLILGHRCPPIVLRVSNDLKRPDMSPLMRWGYRRWLRLQAPAFDAIVAMAPPLAAEIVTEMHARPEQVRVIFNGSIRAHEAHALAAARDGTIRTHRGHRFLAVGRLVPQKNFALLITGFARMAHPDDRLTIVGEGAQRPLLTALAARLGVAAQVDMPGHHNPLGPFFADTDAFVLSSDYEGLPAVVVEALAAGVPIVATDCCASMPMLLADAGLLVPPRDARALATALTAISSTPIDIERMRARAAQFHVEAISADWSALFGRISHATIAATGPGNLVLDAPADPATDR
ncbi:MAG: glycosyltransferase [Sphingomonadaceae bacterium]